MTIFPRKRQRFDELSYYRLNKRGLARYRTMYNDLFVKQGRQFRHRGTSQDPEFGLYVFFIYLQ